MIGVILVFVGIGLITGICWKLWHDINCAYASRLIGDLKIEIERSKLAAMNNSKVERG